MPDDVKPAEIQAEGRPEWLPEKFKSAEDLARSYGEVEKESGRLRAELDKERQQFTEALQRIEAQPAPQIHTPVGQDPLVAQYAQAMENGDYAQAMLIQAAVSQQATAQVLDQKLDALKPAMTAADEAQRDVAFRMAEDRLAAKHGTRWESDLKEPVYKMLRERPHWLPQAATVEGYESVLAEAASLIEAQQVLSANEAEQRDRLAKLQAQGITGNTSRGPLTGDALAAAEREGAEVQNAKTSSYGSVIRN